MSELLLFSGPEIVTVLAFFMLQVAITLRFFPPRVFEHPFNLSVFFFGVINFQQVIFFDKGNIGSPTTVICSFSFSKFLLNYFT